MPVAQLALVDDANSGRLEVGDVRIERVDVDRDVVHAFSAPLDKARDEARLAGKVLDELDLVVIHVEARDEKGPVPAGVRRAAEAKGEVPPKERQRRIDVTHCEREMIDRQVSGRAAAQHEGDGVSGAWPRQ